MWGTSATMHQLQSPLEAQMINNVEGNKEIEIDHVAMGKLLSREDLRIYAIKAFDRFLEVWNIEDYWKRATTFHAFLSFAQAYITCYPENSESNRICKAAQDIFPKNLTYFTEINPEDKWNDDFGWVGLVALQAHQFLLNLNNHDLAQQYLNLSEKFCWEYMKDNSYDKSPNTKPVPHGCKNNPVKFADEGVKNTVVNALFFLLSIRLYNLYEHKKLDNNERFLEMAYNQWEWFSKWFELQEYEYLKSFNGFKNAALVGERPMAFFNGSDYQNKSHPTWTKGWVWSCDQALLIAALTEWVKLKNKLKKYLKKIDENSIFNADDFDAKVTEIIKKLLAGVQKGMVGNTDGIFHEPPFSSNYSISFSKDYFGGLGGTIRFLDFLSAKKFGFDFTDSTLATVSALWATRNEKTNQFSPEITNDKQNQEYISQFNTLWGTSEQNSKWEGFSSDDKLDNGICQARGLDFLAAAMWCKLWQEQT